MAPHMFTTHIVHPAGGGERTERTAQHVAPVPQSADDIAIDQARLRDIEVRYASAPDDGEVQDALQQERERIVERLFLDGRPPETAVFARVAAALGPHYAPPRGEASPIVHEDITDHEIGSIREIVHTRADGTRTREERDLTTGRVLGRMLTFGGEVADTAITLQYTARNTDISVAIVDAADPETHQRRALRTITMGKSGDVRVLASPHDPFADTAQAFIARDGRPQDAHWSSAARQAAAAQGLAPVIPPSARRR